MPATKPPKNPRLGGTIPASVEDTDYHPGKIPAQTWCKTNSPKLPNSAAPSIDEAACKMIG